MTSLTSYSSLCVSELSNADVNAENAATELTEDDVPAQDDAEASTIDEITKAAILDVSAVNDLKATLFNPASSSGARPMCVGCRLTLVYHCIPQRDTEPPSANALWFGHTAHAPTVQEIAQTE
eukprot:5677193-Karenia_brevis.AAC.1